VRYRVLDCNGKLEAFLKIVSDVRDQWGNQYAERIGEEEPPWFRGQDLSTDGRRWPLLGIPT